MAGRTITGTVGSTVTIGSGGYLSPLTIASTGEILSTIQGATGIYLPNLPALTTIVNHGKVYGAVGAFDNYSGQVGGGAIMLNSGAVLTNTSFIAGGHGGDSIFTGGGGGYGIDATTIATIVNSGTVHGGTAAYGRTGTGTGGIGIDLATNATLTNSGIIYGGTGGTSYYDVVTAATEGFGGAAVAAAQEDVITNTGYVIGGAGGVEGNGAAIRGFQGGTGIEVYNGGTLTNGGHITGGEGGGDGMYLEYGGGGGNAVYLNGATATNTGTMAGGGGSNGGVYGGDGGNGANVTNYALLINKGTAIGGDGASNATVGGGGQYGVHVYGYATVNNSGHIIGGDGGGALDANARGGSGGGGVYMKSGLLTNSGTISGGYGGSAYTGNSGSTIAHSGFGGYGVNALYSNYNTIKATIVNYGLIQGGAGGEFYGHGGLARGGGAGVRLSWGTLTNKGTIIGGAGGVVDQNSSYATDNGVGGAGGAGVFIYAGSRLVNTGKITGGIGGASAFSGTIGGAGVAMYGGTLVTSGTITGGAGGVRQTNGAQGDAVYLYGSVGGTLVINPGAVFHGSVVAVTTADNVLEFAGATTGTVQGIGSTFSGFHIVSFASGSTRAIEGTLSALHNIAGFAPHDSIILDGYTDNLAATKVAPNSITLSTGGTTTVINTSGSQFNDIIITDSGSKTTIAPALGSFVHTLTSGMEQYVLAGATATSLLKTGGVEEVSAGGTAAKTTISGGELELQIGAKIASGVTFSTVTHGELKLDSSTIPAGTIAGFIAGDTISLAGVVYNKYDRVTVGTAGVVSIVTPGKTYNLDIAGATAGETDFVFGAGSLLTKKASAAVTPKMQFIAPLVIDQAPAHWLWHGMPAVISDSNRGGEPVFAAATIAAQPTRVGFPDLSQNWVHVGLASWNTHGS